VALWDEGLFAEVAELLGTPVNGDESVECVRGFIGNRRSREVHDPAQKRRNCQLDEIVEPWPFRRAEEAFDAGFDGCACCMSEHHTRRRDPTRKGRGAQGDGPPNSGLGTMTHDGTGLSTAKIRAVLRRWRPGSAGLSGGTAGSTPLLVSCA
jgi:hypothetical protein